MYIDREKLKILYKTKGLTQRDLADRMQMSVTNFSNFFNKQPIPTHFAVRVLHAMDMSEDDYDDYVNKKDEEREDKQLLIKLVDSQKSEIATLKEYVDSLRLNNDLLRKELQERNKKIEDLEKKNIA